MSEFTDYLLESIVANIREEYNKNPHWHYTEDDYIIRRLSTIAEKLVKDTQNET